MATKNIMEELSWRGLVYDHTEGLPDLLSKEKVTVYNGFDPTSDSLQVGNLLALMGLARLQRHGHTPIALAGGGTGLVGDPSGKAHERQLLSTADVEANVEAIKLQLASILDFEVKSNPATGDEQRRLAGVAEPDGVPARRGQALHGELHDGEGFGQSPAGG